MSQSSDAALAMVFGGVFRASMRHAAPILFWSAIALLVLTIAAYSSPFMFPSETDQTDSALRAQLIFNGFVQGLNNAVWPFTGAALVKALNQRADGGAQ